MGLLTIAEGFKSKNHKKKLGLEERDMFIYNIPSS
jgi:hypothetical protein